MVAHSEYQWINRAVVMSILHRTKGLHKFLQDGSPLAARSFSKWTTLGASSVLCKAPRHVAPTACDLTHITRYIYKHVICMYTCS